MTRLWFALMTLMCLITPVWAQFTEPPLIDDCNRTEDPLSQSGQWSAPVITTNGSGWNANGTVCVPGLSGTTSAWWNVLTFGPDMAMSATFTDAAASAGNFMTLSLRITSPNVDSQTDGYQCAFRGTSDDVLLERIDNSAVSVIQNCPSVTIVSGNKIGCQIIGSTLKAFLNTGSSWAEVCSVTDATYSTAGFAGLRSNQSGFSIDDIRAGSVTGVGTTIGALMPILQ